jgi:predicted acyltransferase
MLSARDDHELPGRPAAERRNRAVRLDVLGYRRWTYPFLVVGATSIAMYVIVHVATDYMFRAFRIHLGHAVIDHIATAFQAIVLGAATLGVFWLILLWMYRRRVLIRI